MDYTVEELQKHPLYDLRVLGREIGISNVTSCRKSELIDKIVRVSELKQTLKKKPQQDSIEDDKRSRGRPCKERLDYVIKDQVVTVINSERHLLIFELEEIEKEMQRMQKKIKSLTFYLQNSKRSRTKKKNGGKNKKNEDDKDKT